mgnify:CR=1 FL=1
MICNCCKSTNIKYLLFDTNSTYTYCINWNKLTVINNEIKNQLDSIENDKLEKIKDINGIDINDIQYNEENLKIEVKKENNLILLIINDIKVFETQFNYDFVKKDIYYLETIISELVQDYYKFDLSKVDIVVYE